MMRIDVGNTERIRIQYASGTLHQLWASASSFLNMEFIIRAIVCNHPMDNLIGYIAVMPCDKYFIMHGKNILHEQNRSGFADGAGHADRRHWEYIFDIMSKRIIC